MEILIKLRLFISFDLKTKLLFMEAYFYLGWAYILLKRPFKNVVPILGIEKHETVVKDDIEQLPIIKKVSNAIQIMSRYTLWDSKCLVKAVASMKMLERRKIDSTLYLGTARNDAGKMVAHAWLRSGTFLVSGIEGMKKFTVVSYFAKEPDVAKLGRNI